MQRLRGCSQSLEGCNGYAAIIWFVNWNPETQASDETARAAGTLAEADCSVSKGNSAQLRCDDKLYLMAYKATVEVMLKHNANGDGRLCIFSVK